MRFPQIRAIAVLVLLGLSAAIASCSGTQAVLSRNVVKASPSPSTGPSPSPLPSPSPTPSPTGSPTPTPSPQLVGMNLTNPLEQPTIDPNYGEVLGYFSSTGTIDVNSQVVTLPAGAAVTFENFDIVGLAHTASFLGDATANSAPWPSPFNGSATQSPAGTVINTPMFSTGPIDGGATSLQYITPPPGFYMFGCFFHYDLNVMRTVIISQ
jgi:plastocyanin